MDKVRRDGHPAVKVGVTRTRTRKRDEERRHRHPMHA